MEQGRGRGREKKPAQSSGPRTQKDQSVCVRVCVYSEHLYFCAVFFTVVPLLPALCLLLPAVGLSLGPLSLWSWGSLPVHTAPTSSSSPSVLVSSFPLLHVSGRTSMPSLGVRDLESQLLWFQPGLPEGGAVEALLCWGCTPWGSASAHTRPHPQPTVPTGGHLASESQSRAGGLQGSRPLASRPRRSLPSPGPLPLGSAHFLFGWGSSQVAIQAQMFRTGKERGDHLV